jgi:arabinose-5-phosphate isomerase
MTAKGLGMTTVISNENKLVGIFTDGDLRRLVDLNVDINVAKISEVMSSKPKTISPDVLAAEALAKMETSCITTLVVEDNDKNVCGVIHLHDLLRAGVV